MISNENLMLSKLLLMITTAHAVFQIMIRKITKMFLQHFGLKHAPLGKNSPSLWQDGNLIALQERFTNLLHSPGIGVLTGEPGVGKTVALHHCAKSLNPHQHQIFYIAETNFTSFDIYRQLALTLGLVPASRYAQVWRDI